MRRLLILLVLPALVITVWPADVAADATDEGLDTTRVRVTTKVKKSFGETVADIPGEILKLPLYTVELVSRTIATNPPVSEAAKLIDLGKEVRPYVPVVGYGTRPGLKLGFGLRMIKGINPPDYLKGKWYYSTNDYQSYRLGLRFEELFSRSMGLDLHFRYQKRPRERFYGIGMSSSADKEAAYTLEHTEFKAEVPFHSSKRVYFSLIGSYLVANLYDGRHPDREGNLDTVFNDPDYGLDSGRFDDSRYYTIGASFEYDGRDNRGQPSRGMHFYARYLRYTGVDRSEGLDLNKYTIDARTYLEIWRKRIIAVRAYLQRFDADFEHDRAIPIHMTSTLGGKDVLRGYTRGRFMDNDLAVVSVEYRYPIYEVIDAFLFLDEGRVYEKITDERFFAGWEHSFGFGLRLWNPGAVTAMAQIARSDEDTRFYIELGSNW